MSGCKSVNSQIHEYLFSMWAIVAVVKKRRASCDRFTHLVRVWTQMLSYLQSLLCQSPPDGTHK